MNRNIKKLSRRLYSPSLKDVAWLERAQLVFLIFRTFVFKFGRVEGVGNYGQMYEKLEKFTERLLFNIHSSNLVNTIFHFFHYTK